ncbi:MAG TPA: hypothetical protein VKG26_08985 [Bacteroidia bacterium]|nr:hypothetical protein [Bacteroidia bacterium]
MKKLFLISFVFIAFLNNKIIAQDTTVPEKFGNTLNMGVGVGYYGYVGNAAPAFNVNYEFDLFRNFTLAPFVGIYTFEDYYYWGNPNLPPSDPSYRNYYYREVVIPVGAKGTYYFDQLFHAGPRWDFYAAASIGFAFRSVIWDNAYNGDRSVYQDAGPLYMNLHIGSEYHLSQKAGLFLDLSTGVSTFGLAIHF